MHKHLILLSVLLFALSTSVLQARIINVPADSTTIQGGINGAIDGDTVMVAPGFMPIPSSSPFLGSLIS